MKLFLDTADLAEIRWASRAGLIDGVTTNPSLLAKAAGDVEPHDVLKEICSLVDGPVSAEVVAVEGEGMYRDARELARIAENIVVKIPMIEEGLPVIRRLAGDGIRVNVTLCFSSVQCLIAAKAGATFISPFVGRLDDIATDGMAMVADIVSIYENYGFDTEVLVASVRHPMHVLDAARMGAHVATVPYKVIAQLVKHPLTDIGLERFLADARKAQGK